MYGPYHLRLGNFTCHVHLCGKRGNQVWPQDAMYPITLSRDVIRYSVQILDEPLREVVLAD